MAIVPLKGDELAKVVGGVVLSGGQIPIKQVSVDSRSLESGDFFVPLKGTKCDGHSFIAKALKKGARGFLVEWEKREIAREFITAEIVVIAVENSLQALQAMAKHNRSILSIPVIGITGSTGKTSTKDMVASILSQSKRVVCSEESYNNEIGVPLTLLKAESNTEVMIVEMGMRGLGQITELAKMVMPSLGLITNVGKTHLELLGSEQRIMEAKSELIRAIPKEGAVVLNSDDSWTEKLRSLTSCPVITYGLSSNADVRAVNIKSIKARPSFILQTVEGDISINLPVLGKHNIYNALAASAVALQLGERLENIKYGLESCQISKMRMECFTTADGITVLNDTYNANPTSMEAALQTLQDVASNERKIAVLGDMVELGPIAEESHYQIGEAAFRLGVDILIVVGEMSKYIAEGALSGGMSEDDIFICRSIDEAVNLLASLLRTGDVVLVKASRALKMEEVVNSIVISHNW